MLRRLSINKIFALGLVVILCVAALGLTVLAPGFQFDNALQGFEFQNGLVYRGF
jgi:hypothetical protein